MIIMDKEVYGLSLMDGVDWHLYKRSSMMHENKICILGLFKAADRFGFGLHELERIRVIATVRNTDLCLPPKTPRHQACLFGAGRGLQPAML